jgi:hypothetical protein
MFESQNRDKSQVSATRQSRISGLRQFRVAYGPDLAVIPLEFQTHW